MQRVANSPSKDSTLIIALEDDAQDGPDHVSAHRSTIYVAGPYVKQKALVSEYYTTVNVIRTIEDLLDTEHLNLNTATARPMSELFDLKQTEWDFKAKPADVLYQSDAASDRPRMGSTPQPAADRGHCPLPGWSARRRLVAGATLTTSTSAGSTPSTRKRSTGSSGRGSWATALIPPAQRRSTCGRTERRLLAAAAAG